jgi:hypothetical protein
MAPRHASAPARRPRSVDRGTRRQGHGAAKSHRSACRRRTRERKATRPGAPTQVPGRPRAVEDPVHAPTPQAREPGGLLAARRRWRRWARAPLSLTAYAGHDCLMDGLHLPPAPPAPHPVPSSSSTCPSATSAFRCAMRARRRSPPCAFNAPEGYVMDAIAESRSVDAVRSAAVEATARWRIARGNGSAVGTVFGG